MNSKKNHGCKRTAKTGPHPRSGSNGNFHHRQMPGMWDQVGGNRDENI